MSANVTVTVVVVNYHQRQRDEARAKPVVHHKTPEGVPGLKLTDRKCTDPLLCCLFVFWILGMLGISAFAFSNGNLQKIVAKYDMYNNTCEGQYPNKMFPELKISDAEILSGVAGASEAAKNAQAKAKDSNAKTTDTSQDAAAEQFKKLYAKAHYSVCVKKCPKKNAEVAFKANDKYKKGNAELKSWKYYTTQDVMGYCLPDQEYMKSKFSVVAAQMSEALGNFARYTNDVVISYPLILIMVFVSLLITVAYLYLLKWITKPILYVSLVLVFIFGALITVWCYKKAQVYPEGSDDRKYALGYAWAAGILTVIYVAVVCFQWKNIRIGAEIMGLAGDFVSTSPKIIATPFVAYFTMVPITVWFSFSMVYLYATGEPVPKAEDMFTRLEETRQAYWMFWFFLFGFFWIVAYLVAVMQFVIAATCAVWYFTYQQQGGSDAPPAAATAIQRSFKWATRTHAGSLAFGSLLIAIVTMVKFIFEWFAEKQEKLNKNNAAMQAALRCTRCCIWCLDSCVKFVSENAYVQIAVSGTTFCEGAQRSFWMLARNPGVFIAMNVAGWFMTAIGKGLIMGLSVYITMALADANVGTGGEVIQQPFVPAFIVLLIAWAVAAFFISLFDFACLTILQCFLISKEITGKLWAPPKLLDLLDDNDEDKQAMRKNQIGSAK